MSQAQKYDAERDENQYPNPPGNPDFETYPESFQNKIDERFQAGIVLSGVRTDELFESIATTRVRRITEQRSAAVLAADRRAAEIAVARERAAAALETGIKRRKVEHQQDSQTREWARRRVRS